TSTRQDAVALGGLDPAKLHVVPLGVGGEWHPIDSSGGEPYIVFVGLLKPHKNLGVLLSAFESIADRIPHRLVLIAKHEGLRSIDEAALEQARRLAPRVELHDAVSAQELQRIVAGADLLVHPSLHEGFGLTPLEAMAAGVPVIASATGAIADYGGDAVRFIDPRSSAQLATDMLEVLQNPSLRATMRSRGIALARRYTWTACADATVGIIETAVEQERRTA
ncbi:MAG TPA: glycosyltransferase family 1 protein, partial [Casimicrobiaceae bacterium]|nr:glycosyltransferase family 1 protein [Casimicrobiaceae bacterium]